MIQWAPYKMTTEEKVSAINTMYEDNKITLETKLRLIELNS